MLICFYDKVPIGIIPVTDAPQSKINYAFKPEVCRCRFCSKNPQEYKWTRQKKKDRFIPYWREIGLDGKDLNAYIIKATKNVKKEGCLYVFWQDHSPYGFLVGLHIFRDFLKKDDEKFLSNQNLRFGEQGFVPTDAIRSLSILD